MEIKPFKIKVTPEQSIKVQEICIANGVSWNGNKETINSEFPILIVTQFPDFENKLNLNWSNDLEHINYDESHYSRCLLPTLLTFDEFMEMYNK